MSQEKISCLFSFGPPPRRQSPVSCLMRKSPASWKILMSHAFSINLKRKSHETWDFLMRQETGDFLVGGGPKMIRYEIFSWDMRFSLVTHKIFSWDRTFSHTVPPWEILLSPVSWENLMSHEIFLWDLWRKHEKWEYLIRQEIFFWDRRREIFSLGGGPKTDNTWDFLLINEIFSGERRQ